MTISMLNQGLSQRCMPTPSCTPALKSPLLEVHILTRLALPPGLLHAMFSCKIRNELQQVNTTQVYASVIVHVL